MLQRLSLLVVALLLTGCAGVQRTNTIVEKPLDINDPVDDRPGIPLVIPTGPNAVGYETIILGQRVTDENVKLGSVMACEINLEKGNLWLLEGLLASKDPLILDVPVYNTFVPFALDSKAVSFCLMTDKGLE